MCEMKSSQKSVQLETNGALTEQMACTSKINYETASGLNGRQYRRSECGIRVLQNNN